MNLDETLFHEDNRTATGCLAMIGIGAIMSAILTITIVSIRHLIL